MIIGTKEHPVRLSFVKLDKPAPTKDGSTNKYSVQVVIDKSHTDVIEACEKAIAAAINDGVAKKMFAKAVSNNPAFRRALRDGDQKAAEIEDGSQNHLKGCMFFNATSPENRPPQVVDKFNRNYETSNGDRSAIKTEVYSGCYGIVSGNFYPFSYGNGGIGFGLNHVMKREEGPRLDGMVSADEAFKDLVESEGAEPSEGGSGDDLR